MIHCVTLGLIVSLLENILKLQSDLCSQRSWNHFILVVYQTKKNDAQFFCGRKSESLKHNLSM